MAIPRKVLLIGWDAADWKVIHPLMDQGQMPHLQRLVEGGVMGQMATLRPPLSPLLWTSIATGMRPFKHGIHGFTEPTPDGLDIRPVTNLSRRVKAVWNILNQCGKRSLVVGWWPSHPAEPLNGAMVSDYFHKTPNAAVEEWPLAPGCVHPPELAETLAELRLRPQEVAGEMIDYFVPKARDVDQDKDTRLASLTRLLCECVNVHSAATFLLDSQPWDFAAIYYDAIDHFSHGFMRYHPPRQDWIEEKDFEVYQGVVAAAYRFHDMLLGKLLTYADENTAVLLVSDHGFHPDHLRPRHIPRNPTGPAIEHRDFGILAMRGPGLKKDELMHGACVLDVTPTVLTLFGLPVGEDMDGRVLVGAFQDPPAVQVIPSWEAVAGPDGRHAADRRLDPVASQEALQQLVALGYIAQPDENRAVAVTNTIRELRFHLAQSYQDADRHGEALSIFRQLHEQDNNEQRFAVHRFTSCQALGLVEEMRAIVADLDGRRRQIYDEAVVRLNAMQQTIKERLARRKAANPESVDKEIEEKPEPLLSPEEQREWAEVQKLTRFEPPVVDFLQAQVRASEGRYQEALDLLQQVSDAHLIRPGLFIQTADLCLKLRRWDEAEEIYRKALAVDPDNPHAHVGTSRMALRRRDYETAASAALAALQRLYHYPMAHFLLGAALVGMNRPQRAAEALRLAITLNPNFPQAHWYLAWLLRRRLNDPAGAAEHLRLCRELREGVPTLASADTDSSPLPGLTPPEDLSPVELGKPDDAIVIVTGLPRSGTSMLMQMLAAGGVDILTDAQREADEDNPRGYLEYEPVKQLHTNNEWLSQARGKAVKIVAPLLHHLPATEDYRVLMIERHLDEVLASQEAMLRRRGETVDESPARRQRLREQYTRQILTLRRTLAARPRTKVLHVNYAQVVSQPAKVAEAINAFLGGELSTSAMTAAVQPSLQRQAVEQRQGS